MLNRLAGEVDTNVGEILGDAGMTVLIGVVVVFATLLLLTFVFWLFGKITGGFRSKTKNKPAPKAPAARKPAEQSKAVLQPTVQAGISNEVVAAIAAAVACMAPEGKQYKVRSVSRARGERPVWAAAGLAESTRPF